MTLFGAKPMRLEELECRRCRPRRRRCTTSFVVVDVAPGELQRVDQAGRGDDRGAVLVVVEDRDVHQLAQALLDDEAFRRLDVLEVDAAEGRRRDSAPQLMNASGSSVSTSRSMESTSAKRLNSTALPSITGFEASAPRLPRPRIAVPLEITATRLPLAV